MATLPPPTRLLGVPSCAPTTSVPSVPARCSRARPAAPLPASIAAPRSARRADAVDQRRAGYQSGRGRVPCRRASRRRDRGADLSDGGLQRARRPLAGELPDSVAAGGCPGAAATSASTWLRSSRIRRRRLATGRTGGGVRAAGVAARGPGDLGGHGRLRARPAICRRSRFQAATQFVAPRGPAIGRPLVTEPAAGLPRHRLYYHWHDGHGTSIPTPTATDSTKLGSGFTRRGAVVGASVSGNASFAAPAAHCYVVIATERVAELHSQIAGNEAEGCHCLV